MTPFETALQELADEIDARDVPPDLRARAWEEGRARRPRRRARRMLAPVVAVAAAAVLVLWMVVGLPGADRGSAPARPDQPGAAGYPERVRYQSDPDPLPPTAGPVTAVISPDVDEDSTRSEGQAANGGGLWQAITPDGRLWDLSGAVLPEPDGVGPRDSWTVVGTPALTSDGTRLAAVRTISAAQDADGSSTTDTRAVLDLHDLRTGEHHVVDDLPASATTDEPTLAWSPEGSAVAMLVGDGASAQVVTVAADGTSLATASAPGRTGAWRRPHATTMVGWRDDRQIMLVRFARSGWQTVVEPWTVDSRTGAREILAQQRGQGQITRYRGGGTPFDAFFAPWDEGITMPDDLEEDGAAWLVLPDLDEASRTTSRLRWASPIASGDRSIGDARLQQRGGEMVVAAQVSDTGIVTRGRPGGEQRLLTVIDPRLGASTLVVAAEATDRRIGTSVFGTADGWWAWYPGRTMLGALAVLVGAAALVWLGRRGGRGRPRSDAGSSTART